MAKLYEEEGSYLFKKEPLNVKEGNYEETIGSVTLAISYYRHSTKDNDSGESIAIRTENNGAGNYFVLEINSEDKDGQETSANIAFTKLEELEDIIKDFKKRYNLIKRRK